MEKDGSIVHRLDLWNGIRRHFKRLVRLQTSPHSIALGFSFGTFWSILPTPGISIILAMMTLVFFTRMSKVSLFVSFAVWNPFVTVPLNMLGMKLGSRIFSGKEVIIFEIKFLNQVISFTRRILVGNLLLALLISISSYFLLKYLLIFIKNKRRRK